MKWNMKKRGSGMRACAEHVWKRSLKGAKRERKSIYVPSCQKKTRNHTVLLVLVYLSSIPRRDISLLTSILIRRSLPNLQRLI